MQVQDIMTRAVRTCGPDESLDVAARLLWDNDIGCLPVTDADQHPVAMLTDRDICMAAYTQGLPLRDIPVRTAMSSSVHAAAPSDSLARAEERMREFQLRRLPVVDASGRLVGLIAMTDIAREAARERRQRQREVTGEEVMTTLAAVSRPRVCSIEAHKLETVPGHALLRLAVP